jgi:hypothetical protein
MQHALVKKKKLWKKVRIEKPRIFRFNPPKKERKGKKKRRNEDEFKEKQFS